MTTPRKRLAQRINPTRTKNGHLSPKERAMVVHALLCGEKPSVLATRFRVHRNTIHNILKRYRTTHGFDNKPKKGRPYKLTYREKRALYRRLRKNPEMPHAQLQTWVESYTGKKVSRRTLRRALHATGLKHWKSLKRMYLNKRAIEQRRQYAREWRGREHLLSLVRPLLLPYIYKILI